MTLAAVLDAGPIIHLAEIGSLELLSAFDRLHVPETVYEELESGGVPTGLTDVSYENATADGDWSGTDQLDAGERAAISVANEHDAVLLTDDLSARDSASEADIEVHGSVGILVLGYARDLIEKDEAASRMRALQHETSLFVTDTIVERGIRMLDEQ